MRKRILLPLMLVLLALGFAVSYATTPVSAVIMDTLTTDTGGVSTTTDPVTTTDSTSTQTTSTTTPETTSTTTPDTTSTTTPETTSTTTPETTSTTTPAADPTSSTTTTTAAATSTTSAVPTTGGENSGSSGQTSDQTNVGSPGGAGGQGTCDPSSGLSCGNNASTQIALVEQVCNATSNTAIMTDVTVGGATTSYMAAPHTTCNNVAYITQVVNQVCVNCTLKLHVTYNTYNTYNSTTQQYVQAAIPNARAFYCAPQPVLRADGTMGRFLDLSLNQPLTDPRYYGSVPAVFVKGVGLTCPETSTAAAETQAAPRMVSITVPLGFVGQYLNVCSGANGTTACRSLKIDAKGFVAFPVDANIICTITKKPVGKVMLATSGAVPAVAAEKSTAEITSAAKAYGAAGAAALAPPKSMNAAKSVGKGRK